MAALVALTLLWFGVPALQVRPLLIEVGRIEVSSTVRSLTVSFSGAWYVSDPEQHTVTWCSPSGRKLSTVGGYGWGLSALDHPTGVATDGNRVYVADRGNHRIVSYDRQLRPLGSLITKDTSEYRARFGYPKAVAVSGRGDLIVLDGESEEVVGFRPDRRVAFRIGRDVPGGTVLTSPTCLAVGRDELVIVGETGGLRMFDLFGNELRRISLGGATVLRGVAGSKEWISAVSADTLYLVHVDNGTVHHWSRQTIVPDVPLEEFWAVAWEADRLLVLSRGSIVALTVHH